MSIAFDRHAAGPVPTESAPPIRRNGVAAAAVTCVVVDDHALLREGMRLGLEANGIEVLGEAGDGTEAMELVRRLRPAVVLLDMRLPGEDGAHVAQRITEEGLGVRTLIVSAYAEPAIVARALEHGSHGYLSKDAPIAMVAAAVRSIAGGKRFVDPGVAGRLLCEEGTLSEREVEVLEMMSRGMQNMTIAHELGISVETVKAHVSRVMGKLGGESRTEAVAIALRSGLIF